MAQNEQLVVALEARIRDFERNMHRANRTAQTQFSRIERRGAQASRNLQAQFASSAAGINTALSSIGVNFGGIGALGRAGMFGAPIAAAGAYVVALKKVSAAVAEIGAKADRVGVATEELQKLRFASEQAAGSAAAVDNGLDRFAQNIGEAARGQGDLVKILEANGVALRNQAGELRTTGELFREVANLVKNAANPVDQLTIATKAFGRSAGPELVGLLRGGTEEIDRLSQAAVDAGAVLDDALVRRAQAIDDKFSELSRTVGTTFKWAILEAAGAAHQLYETLMAVPRALNAAIDASREAGGGVAEGVAAIDAQIRTLQAQIEEHRAIHNQVAITALEGRIEELRAERELIAEAAREFARANAFARSPASGGLVIDVNAAPRGPTIIPPSNDNEGGGRARGGGGGGSRENALERETAAIHRRIAALQIEALAVGLSAFEADKLRTAETLLNAAREGGVAITPKLRGEVEMLAHAYATAAEDVRKLEEAQQALAEISGQIGDAFTSAFGDMITGAKSAEDAIRSLINQLARLLLNKALSSLFGGIFGALGFADGGLVQGFVNGGNVRGPGSSRSDSIPAMLSNGEFVVKASEAARHRELLERINSGQLPRYANGGAIGAPSIPALSSSSAGGMAITVAPTINIEGGSQGPEADEQLAKKITRQIEQMTRQVVASEIRRQSRPGGMMNNVRV